MSSNNNLRIILIEQSTLLSLGLVIETEGFMPGWNVVKNFDRGGLTRKIENARWNFFFLSGPIKTTVMGRVRPAAPCRAVKRVIASRKGESRNLNSLEFTKIALRRFLVIPFLSITAYTRHIQEGIRLVPAKNFVLRMPVAAHTENLATKNLAVATSGS